MKVQENIISNFLKDQPESSWKIVGLEQDDKFLLIQTPKTFSPKIHVGIYYKITHNYQVVYTTDKELNIIQASINYKNNVLAFVTKEKPAHQNDKSEALKSKHTYEVHILNLKTNLAVSGFAISSSKQIMVQFLYRKKPMSTDRFLVFTHLQSITLYDFIYSENELEVKIKLAETITNSFSWSQWDVHHQCLFYIHYKQAALKDDDEKPTESTLPTPILSALQFHDDLPHETVLNIPLNLPEIKQLNAADNLQDAYDDVPVPLRVRDCSQNISVIMQSTGTVYICNYYFYQTTAEPSSEKSNTVNFAYSVTVLHHGCIIHCTIPGINWKNVADINPVFCLFDDQHLTVHVTDSFIQVLDLGINHEPCCHFVLHNSTNKKSFSNMVAVPGTISEVIDLKTFDIWKVSISKDQLVDTFSSQFASVNNKLSILHYILIHLNDLELTKKLISVISNKLTHISTVKLLKEIIIGGCYASVNRHISSDALDLLRLLPLTTTYSGTLTNEKINDYTLNLEQEMLCNPSVMLLTPRQRLIPFRSDVWTKLWNHLPNHILTDSQTSRFKNSVVVEKLAVSLVCYQPEALSRCCTPLSPGAPHLASTGMLADVANISRSNKSGMDPLPFNEIEASAASKQEHVISVNLREISLHLVKFGKSPMQVHAVAMRYVSSQLEISRILCSYLTQAIGIDTKRMDRDFVLIDRLPKEARRVFLAILERYYIAVDSLAFPLPQGFPSFFTYLGYRVFPAAKFADYVRANVFQVNIDVMKAIMADLPDKGEGLKNKLNLLLQLPRSRVKRILNQWSHPVSLMIRAREHSLNILAGISGMQSRSTALPKGIRHSAGLTAFPSNERLSPLDTFLDLLTAKANLAEIDFSLLIAATIASTENFLEE